MDPDKYQQAWQAQSSQTRVTIDANLLLKEVQRSQRTLRDVTFRRDVLEVGIALLLVPVWIYLGVTTALPWTWYLTVPVLVWLIGFMLVYRLRHPQKSTEPDEPLLQRVKNSLTQVEDQIFLLRNIFWWYLLPPTISILAFFAHVTWLNSEDWLDALGHAPVFVFLLAVYAFVYYLNQHAVRLQLEPRRQELLTLLASLGDETTSGESAAMKTTEGVKTPGILRSPISVLVLLVTLALVGSAVAVFVDPAAQYAKRAPFTGVRWEGEKPLVEIDDEWFELVSLDGLSASEIVAFSRRNYSGKWQKRFEEDLVEVLAVMGHEPKDTVRLVVMPLGSSLTRTLEDVPMTRANRQAIREAAQARGGASRAPDRLIHLRQDALVAVRQGRADDL